MNSETSKSTCTGNPLHIGGEVAVKLRELLARQELYIDLDHVDSEGIFNEEFENQTDLVYDMSALQEHLNFDCIDSSEALPFEELGAKMTESFLGDKVKKRVLKPGTVPIPQDASVRIHYNCYTEMDEVPFGSTYLSSRRPIKYTLGQGSYFLGLEMAILTMAVGEKAQFLIHPDLAFGALGSVGRVPPNATVMLIIEVFQIDDSPEEAPLSVQDRRNFAVVYERAKLMNSEANSCVSEGYVCRAIALYRRAEDLLGVCSLENDEEQDKFQRFLLKLYTNMAICFNSPKVNLPKRACVAVRKAFEIDPERAAVNPKLFYHRGVALMALADYKGAKADLTHAHKLLPNDERINEKIAELEKKEKSYEEHEKNLYSAAFLGFSRTSMVDIPQIPDGITDDCKASATKLLEEFADGDSKALNLSGDYTVSEREWLKAESERLGLKYKETAIDTNRYDVLIIQNRPVWRAADYKIERQK